MFKDFAAVFAYREMLFNTVRRELRSRYKGSVLGFLWTFLNPLLSLVVYTLVFSIIMRAKIPQHSFSIYLFTGLLPWLYFANTIQQSTILMHNNSNLIKKIYFPRLVLPISLVATNLVNLLLSSIILLVALIIEGVSISWVLVYIPLLLLLLTFFILSITLLLSALTVYFRDIEHIMTIVTMAWFYVTPIVYAPNLYPSNVYRIFMINPLMPLITGFQDVLLYNTQPNTWGLAYVFLISDVLFIVGYFVFDKLQRRFAEEM